MRPEKAHQVDRLPCKVCPVVIKCYLFGAVKGAQSECRNAGVAGVPVEAPDWSQKK